MLSESQNWIREHNPDAEVQVTAKTTIPARSPSLHPTYSSRGKKTVRSSSAIHFSTTTLPANNSTIYWLIHPLASIGKPSRRNSYVSQVPRLCRQASPCERWGAIVLALHDGRISRWSLSKDKKHGSRCAIVFNGSPLFTGGAGSGESEIRRWIIENDRLEAIIALPEHKCSTTRESELSFG